MRIVFIPEGGFHKTGAFVELGPDEELSDSHPRYERDISGKIDLVCYNLTISYRYKVDPHPRPTEDALGPYPLRLVTSVGHIQASKRWCFDRSRLSVFGKEREHSSINVTICEVRPESTEVPTFIGGSAYENIDLFYEEEFSLWVPVETPRMDEIMQELEREGSTLTLEVNVSNFPGFYSQWSPSFTEARLFKFLETRNDIENQEDVPKEFWERQTEDYLLNLDLGAPVTIVVSHSRTSPKTGDDTEDEDDIFGDDDATDPDTQTPDPLFAAIASLRADTEAHQKRLRSRILWAALIIAGAILLARL